MNLVGMAVRLSADLGLHLDVIEEYRNGMLSQRDFDVRRTTFWGVFIHDKYVIPVVLHPDADSVTVCGACTWVDHGASVFVISPSHGL